MYLVNIIHQLKFFEKQVKISKTTNRNEIVSSLQLLKESIGDIFTNLDEEYNDLKTNNEKLLDTNQRLKEQFLTHEKAHYKSKQCIHCHSTFVPKYNDDVFLIKK